MVERVLFVLASAGEETVSTGATIARLRADGAHVTVVTCVRNPGAARDLEDALRALGVQDHRYLGSASARWQGLAPREYTRSGSEVTALTAADLGEIASDIGAVILDVEPDVVVSHPAGAADPAQRQVHDATAWATEALRTPFYVIGKPGGHGAVRVGSPELLARKHSALAAYRGHVTLADGDAAEVFSRVHPQAHFARTSLVSRALSSLLALALGVFTGALLTAVHQSAAVVNGQLVPWGLIVSLAIVTALIAGLRLVYETRVVAGVATVGLLGAEAFLALTTPGGSIIVPDNIVGAVWTIGSVLIAAVVLAWPRVVPRSSDRMKSPAAKGPEHP